MIYEYRWYGLYFLAILTSGRRPLLLLPVMHVVTFVVENVFFFFELLNINRQCLFVPLSTE